MQKNGGLYKVTQNEIFGRYIIVTQDIKQGQLILKENPVLICPQLGGSTICFNCCAQVKKIFFCSACNIAILCNTKCKDKFHDFGECSLLKTLPIKREDLLTNPEIITPLRCLAWRQSNIKLFETFLKLEDHLQLRKDTQIWRRICNNVENILHKMSIVNDKDIEDGIVQKICAILDINTFDVRPPQRNRSDGCFAENLRGLYLDAAMMAHDCVANAHLAVDDDFILYVRAAVDISEGSPILFNYTNLLKGNDERQSQLKEGKYFECRCSRCNDPTELGTEISSLKCHKCRKGLLRPKIWTCSQCGHKFSDSLVRTTLSECRRLIDTIESPNLETLEKLLIKLSSTFHPHHYLLLEIEQNLIRLYSQTLPVIKNLRRKIELCNKFLEISRKIQPGICRIEAISLYELHSGVVSLAQKIYKSREIDKNEFLKMLFMAEDALKNAVKLLLYEPVKSPEGRLAQNALSELKMLRGIINNLQKENSKQNKKDNNKKKITV